MHRQTAWAAAAAVIGIGLAVTACGGSTSTVKPTVAATQSASATASGSPAASPAASSPAAPVPAGYTRIGGAAQGISIAAPASWVALNPAQGSIASAASKAGLSGISASAIEQDWTTIKKLHGIVVFDVKSAVDNPDHFASNLNAYCAPSGLTDVGAAGVPLLRQGMAAEFAKLGATHIGQRDVEVGGVPGVETSFQLDSSTTGTSYGSQLEVFPKPDKACFVTVTVSQGVSDGSIVSTAAATAQFP